MNVVKEGFDEGEKMDEIKITIDLPIVLTSEQLEDILKEIKCDLLDLYDFSQEEASELISSIMAKLSRQT